MACLAAFAALCPAVALAVPAPAGALIESQAVVSYFNTELGIYESVSTNVVVTRVNSVKAIEVVSDQTVFMAPASVGQFAFFIRNTGNAPLSPSATLEQVAGHHANLVDIRAVIDQNRNGTADPGEWELTPDMAIELPVGGELPVIVQFATPASSHDGQLAALRLSAKDGSVADAATGTVIMSSTGLVLEKSATENEVQAGGRLRYGLRLRNNGANAVAAYAQLDGSSILIDGAAASGILVRDARPLNTRVVNAESAAGFVGLYHVAGQPTHTYVTTLPQDPSAVDAVAFFRAGDYPGGISANLAFEVAVAGNAQEGFILNEASTWQQSGEDLVEVRSNLVRTPVEGGEAALTYAAPDGRPISTAALNSNVRLHLSAAACNTTPGADSVRIRIATDPEADLETAVATETGPNTGLFTTALIPIQRVLPVVQGDSVVSGDRNTKVSASATCGGQTVSAILTVNPGGFVFHSASNVAIPGATVILYDASGAEIERIVSDADGFYVVSAAQNAGAYRIEVLPPEGFSFPSDRKVFPALGRNVDAEASYGAAFTTTGAFSGIDIPLDPDASSVLRLEKSVDEANPAPGDILVYSLTLTNTTGIGLVSAAIRDGLPKGISYLEGTARLDGKPVEVSGFPGRNLTFDLGFVGPDDTVALTYMAAVDPTAQGRLANVALASGNLAGRGEVLSNEARALVRIQRDGGVFSDEGVVLGKVYADLNGNGQQDRYLAAGRNAADGALERVEPGVPGVKLQFSNGASVVTDIDGKYSLPGLPPGSHVIAVSTPTLPATVKLRSTTARDALSPQSRYLRLLPGQVVSEYFAVSPREGVSREEVLAELESRRQAYAENIAASKTVSVPERLNPGGEEWVDYFGRLSSSRREAAKTTETQIVAREQSEEESAESGKADAPQALALDRTRDLEAEIRGLSPALGFLDLEADSLVNSDIVSVRIKGPAEGKLGLNLNGEPVSDGQVGQRVVYASGGVQAAEYVAIRLEGGRNRLEATFSDPFGNVRERNEITVLAPGRPARIELVAPPAAFADPASAIPVLIRFVDADGVPTHASMDVTLETSGRGRWGAEDIRATEPGVQVFVDKGEALVDYYPPALSGTHKIAVRNGLGRYEAEVKLLADDSKRIGAGVVEGVVRLPGSVEPATGLEGFDGVTTGVGGELYTYTVPAGVTRVKVRLVGGVGGTGDNFLRTPFSKGGAARIIDAIVNVVPGDTITGTVGSGGGVNGFSDNGGAGGSGTGRGGDGGDTTSITGGSPGGGGGGGTSLALGGTTVLKAGGGGGGGGAAGASSGSTAPDPKDGGNARTPTANANCNSSGNGASAADISGSSDGGSGGGGGGGYTGGKAGSGYPYNATSSGTASEGGGSCYSNKSGLFVRTPSSSLTAVNSNENNKGADGYVQITELKPSLTKKFSAGSVKKGETFTLTFTLTNPADAAAQTGLAFADTLPGGLVLAGTPAVSQCEGSVSVTDGNKISFSGGKLAAGPSSCTVTAQVTTAETQGPATCAKPPLRAGTDSRSGLAALNAVSTSVRRAALQMETTCEALDYIVHFCGRPDAPVMECGGAGSEAGEPAFSQSRRTERGDRGRWKGNLLARRGRRSGRPSAVHGAL
ncbi:DUF11 domain-containing protein [Sinorhizobium meliloti]|nr:DUF11 domain-containing protein [Sinorhizobium meliloti]MQX94168.1 DUF11 domain-containing protein [Sinorhizobium meliloti]RVI63803.1 DUF11 domain-containing protein [Sinorhizobium meliloti]RVJ68728.1 DUF11 domain-containing protein [Sinorhizobium meliloti]RVL02953.1 DUF11 domain-containing protein [Sinorhizobium meliloti]